jgi:hypothetical protein
VRLRPQLTVVDGDAQHAEDPRPAAGRSRLEEALPALVLVLTAAFALRRLDNTDTWFHLAAGRWIVSHGAIPATDPLSWTVRDHPWLNVQWLFDVLFYWLYKAGGPSLTVIASALVYTATMALFIVNVRRYVGPLTATALGTWAVIISQSRFEIRPEMMSYLLIQVILWLYATGRVVGRKRLWFLPVVMCLFANFHSLFIIGAVVIACHMAGALLSQAPFLPSGWRRPVDPRVRSQILATGAAAFAATIVNPFWLKGAFFPLTLMTELSGTQPFLKRIGELVRPFDDFFVTFSLRAYRVLFFFALAAVVTALLVSAFQGIAAGHRNAPQGQRAERRRAERKRRSRTGRREATAPEPMPSPREEPSRLTPQLDLGDVAVLVGVAYVSFLARRNVALLAIVGGPPLASCLSVVAAGMRRRASKATVVARRAVAGAFAAALIAGCWFVVTNGYYRWNDELREFGLGIFPHCFPSRAVEFMREQKLPGPLFNDFTNGSYFSWSEPIPGGVYVDGRGEVYGAAFFARYERLLANPKEWQAEMDRRGVQTATVFHWWGNHQPLLRYLLAGQLWDIVYYDETTVVAVRHAGNTETIGRAALAFLPRREATERLLLAPTRSWQWQLGRIRGNKAYQRLLMWMGKPEEARPFRENMARLSERRG